MSDCPDRVAATLLFAEDQTAALADLMNECTRTLRNIGLDPASVKAASDGRITLSNREMRVSIRPVDVPALAEVPVAQGAGNIVLARQPRPIRGALMVRAESPVAQGRARAPERALIAACFHISRLLDRELEAATIRWHPTDTDYAPEAFRDAALTAPRAVDLAGAATDHAPMTPPVRAQEPIPAASDPVQPRRPIRSDDAAPRHARPTLDLLKPVRARTPEPKATPKADPMPDRRAHPDPLAARLETRLRDARKSIFSGELIGIRTDDADTPRDPAGITEQVAVYAMAVGLMTFVFPLGFALMLYNILAGENLRLTASVTAVSCMFAAVDFVGLGARLLSLI